jgi:hypothetical protein
VTFRSINEPMVQEIVVEGKLYEVIGPPFLRYYRDVPGGMRHFLATSKIIWYPNVKDDKTGIVDIGEARYSYQEKEYFSLTAEEQGKRFIGAAYNVANDWAAKAEQHNLTTAQICHGVVNGMLKIMDYGTDQVPGFNLHAKDTSDQTFLSCGTGYLKEWPAGECIVTERPLCVHYAELYDKFREKISASATDLFD